MKYSKYMFRCLLLLIASALVACIVNIDFDMVEKIPLFGGDVSVHGTATGTVQNVNVSGQTSINKIILIDPTTQPDLQANLQSTKNSLNNLSMVSIDFSIAQSTNPDPVSISGSIAVRTFDAPTDGSKDLVIGKIDNLAITNGAQLHLDLADIKKKLDPFLTTEIKTNSKFYIVIVGQATGVPDAQLTITCHLSLAYGM